MPVVLALLSLCAKKPLHSVYAQAVICVGNLVCPQLYLLSARISCLAIHILTCRHYLRQVNGGFPLGAPASAALQSTARCRRHKALHTQVTQAMQAAYAKQSQTAAQVAAGTAGLHAPGESCDGS